VIAIVTARIDCKISLLVPRIQRGDWYGLYCARLSYRPIRWQIFFTRPTLRLLAVDFPGRAMSPGEGLLFPSLHHHTSSPKGVAGLSFTARIEGRHSGRAASASKRDGLAAPYPTLLRPRIARALETKGAPSSLARQSPSPQTLIGTPEETARRGDANWLVRR
jgi:hypothetical protein